MTVGWLLNLPKLSFSISDLGLMTLWSSPIDYVKSWSIWVLACWLHAGSHLGLLCLFGFEYWKEPSGMELGLEEPQWVTSMDVLRICFWAWKLETEFIPVGLVYFLHLGMKAVHLSVFLLGSEWLIKISGSLAGLLKKNSLACLDKVLLPSFQWEKILYWVFFPSSNIFSAKWWFYSFLELKN